MPPSVFLRADDGVERVAYAGNGAAAALLGRDAVLSMLRDGAKDSSLGNALDQWLTDDPMVSARRSERLKGPSLFRYRGDMTIELASNVGGKFDPGAIDIRLTSRLRSSRDQVWTWITSVAGISEEMRPYFRMTSPEGVQNLADLKVDLGASFLRSRVFLFGFIPAGTWDFTLVELEAKSGFVEQSPSTFMTSWRHERRILDDPSDPSSVLLSDHVTFVPKSGRRFVGSFLRHVFEHRHRVLKKKFV